MSHVALVNNYLRLTIILLNNYLRLIMAQSHGMYNITVHTKNLFFSTLSNQQFKDGRLQPL